MIQLKLHREERRALMEKYHSIETELKLKAAKDAHQCEEEGRRQLLVQESQHQEALHRARMETIEAENTANQCRVRCEEEVSEVRDRLEKELSDARNEFIRKLQDGLQAAEQRCLETVRLTTAQRDIALAEMKDQQQRVLEEIEEKHAATVAAQLQLIKSLKDELHARGYSNKQGRRIEHPLDT